MPEPEKPFDEAEFLRRTFDRTLREMDRTRTYFEGLFKHTLWAISIVVALILTGGGILGFRSWSDVQGRMDVKLQETQQAITARGQQAIQETDKIIRDRAEAAFKDESIRGYIRQVAREKTGTELSNLIRQTVSDQVGVKVKQEEPQIKETVVQETKRAVDNLTPNISSEVDKKTSQALAPLRAQIESYQEILNVSTLALAARGGNALAFDQLVRIGSLTTTPAGIREISIDTQNAIYLEMNSPLYAGRAFKDSKDAPELKRLLDNPDPFTRWAAVDALAAKGQKDVVPRLMEMINHDNSLWVRGAAYQALQGLTGQTFEKLRLDQWNSWWEANKANWPPK
jgi:HEAT repeat protein